MRFEPYEYQLKAYKFILKNPRCALLLDMGLGKTVITMTALQTLLKLNEIKKILVIAPKRVAEDTWTREQLKWEHLKSLKVVTVLGTEKQRLSALKERGEIYVTNRENVQWLCEKTKFDYDCLVIDELSSFKSPSAKRFKALKKHAAGCKRVIGLTGTPAPNGYMDLWSEFYLIDRGERLERTVTKYRTLYFNNVSYNAMFPLYKLKSGAEKVINGKIEDIALSMKAVDYLKMPAKVSNPLYIKLSDRERADYDELEQNAVLSLTEGTADKSVSALSAASLMNKLLQAASGFVYDEEGNAHRLHERKIEVLKEIIESHEGEPILIYYNFKADKDAILKAFPQVRLLNGAYDIKEWNAGEIPIAIAHPASVGHGLNIQEGGHIIVWYSLCWSLELYEQANARLYRQGQTAKTVIIHHLLTENTVDEKVYRALSEKAVTQEALLKALGINGRSCKYV